MSLQLPHMVQPIRADLAGSMMQRLAVMNGQHRMPVLGSPEAMRFFMPHQIISGGGQFISYPPLHASLPLMNYPMYAKPEQLIHQQEEPKPSYSYIGLIAMAILDSPNKKLVLSDIYQWIMDSYTYFKGRGPGWKNSIRHNLSLNDCFIKAGRSVNGKGHYWCIHPANMSDFIKGDFRRRKAQQRVKKHLSHMIDIPDDDSDLTDSDIERQQSSTPDNLSAEQNASPISDQCSPLKSDNCLLVESKVKVKQIKRAFDMDSILSQPHSPKQRKISV